MSYIIGVSQREDCNVVEFRQCHLPMKEYFEAEKECITESQNHPGQVFRIFKEVARVTTKPAETITKHLERPH